MDEHRWTFARGHPGLGARRPQPVGEKGLGGLERLGGDRAVPTGVHVHPLVRGAEGVEQLETGLTTEQFVVPLNDEQRRASDPRRVLDDAGPGRAGEPHQPEDGGRDAGLGGDERETEDRPHRQPPPPHPCLVELARGDQRVEHPGQVAHHLVGHRRTRRPRLAELEEHELGVPPPVGPAVAVNRAVDGHGRHVQADQRPGQIGHVADALVPRGAVTEQNQRYRPRRIDRGPQHRRHDPPGAILVEAANPYSPR